MAKTKAILTCDLLFGDGGKGTMVDYLVRKYGAHTVIRYNGGSQAAHNVITPENVHHCFAQFGSGTLVPEVATYLSRFMFVDPLRLMSEYDVLRKKGFGHAREWLTISELCPVITPFHKFAGRAREFARARRHGSCGIGVGEAARDYYTPAVNSIFIKDFFNGDVLAAKLKKLQARKARLVRGLLRLTSEKSEIEQCLNEIKSPDLIDRCWLFYRSFSKITNIDDGSFLEKIIQDGTLVFEGAQGVLLDRRHGFRPFVTNSDCTLNNAHRVLAEAGFSGEKLSIGIARVYGTRHGPGPFVTESKTLSRRLADAHNLENEWQGKFRVGWPDLVALKYAISLVGGLDRLALTNVDRLENAPLLKVCVGYVSSGGGAVNDLRKWKDFSERGQSLAEFVLSCRPRYRSSKGDTAELLNLFRSLGVPLGYISKGVTYQDKISLIN